MNSFASRFDQFLRQDAAQTQPPRRDDRTIPKTLRVPVWNPSGRHGIRVKSRSNCRPKPSGHSCVALVSVADVIYNDHNARGKAGRDQFRLRGAKK
jgi:hypothetical protein